MSKASFFKSMATSGMLPNREVLSVAKSVAKGVGLDKVFGNIASKLVLPLGLVCAALLPAIMSAMAVILTIAIAGGIGAALWSKSGRPVPFGIKLVDRDGNPIDIGGSARADAVRGGKGVTRG